MGNDGGSIPKRRELVREAARAPTTAQLKESLAESQEHAWTHCALSSKPLAVPVVSDALGKLYNKDSVLEFLLAEEGSAEKVEGEKVLGGRVGGLRDVVEVKFKTEGEGEGKGKWVCPVTQVKMGPGAKGVYVVPCGHAFAGSVVREVGGTSCVECDQPYAENDVVPILPTAPEDIARLNLRLKTLREKGLTHALKKMPGSKKKRKAAEADGASGEAKTGSSEDAAESGKKKEKERKERKNDGGGIKNASTAYLTKKVMEEQEERNKRRRVEQNENVRSLFRKGEQKPDLKNSRDYMTRGFSLAK